MPDIRKTIWKPDTCGCVIELIWDAALPQEERVHTTPRVEACPAHVLLPTATKRYEAVLAENRMKNQALEVIRQGLPVEHLDANQQLAVEPSITFDEARNLDIGLPEVPRSVRDSLQALLDTEFTTGKVWVS